MMKGVSFQIFGHPFALVLLLALVCVAGWYALRGKRKIPFLVGMLDTLFFLLLVLLLFDISLRYTGQKRVEPEARFLLDVSRSVDGFPLLKKKARQTLSNFIPAMRARGYQTVVRDFGRYLSPSGKSNSQADDQASMSRLLSAWLPGKDRSGYREGSVAILFSDGHFRSYPAISKSSGVPVYPVVLSTPINNSGIKDVSFSGDLVAGKPLSLRIIVSNHAAARLTVSVDGRERIRRQLAAGKRGIVVPLASLTSGDHLLSMRLFVPGDGFLPDNSYIRVFTVRPRPIQVTIMTGLPDPEAGALKRLLIKSGRYGVRHLTPRSHNAATFKRVLGNSRLLILVYPGKSWKEDGIRHILNRVRAGTPLLYLNGRSGFIPQVLQRYLPLQPTRIATLHEGKFPWEMQSSAIRERAPLPSGLPGGDFFRYVFGPLRLAPGARLLTSIADFPVAAIHRFGKGSVAAVFAGPTWDWDLGGAGYGLIFRNHYNFWSGIVGMLLQDTKSNPVTIIPHENNVITGDTITLRIYTAPRGQQVAVRLLTGGDKGQTVEARVSSDASGGRVALARIPTDGFWRIEYALANGIWKDSGGRIAATAETLERQHFGQNLPLLKRIAKDSGGGLILPFDSGSLPPAVKPRSLTHIQVLPLLDNWFILTSMVLLFSASLLLRWKYPDRGL